MSGKRRKYTKEFKTESVEYLLKSNKPMTEVSESLGVDYWLLSKWKKAYLNEGKKAFASKPDLSDLEKENKRLKQALEDAEMEKAILKKAMAIFSRKE